MTFAAIFHHPLVQGAIRGAVTGAGAAAVVDFNNFRSWKSWHDAATYDWGVATFRWFQGAFAGAVLGALTVLGVNLTTG